MELIYNTIFSNLLGKKNNVQKDKINTVLPSDISDKSELDKNLNLLSNDKDKKNNYSDTDYDSGEMPSSISSIDSINSDYSTKNEKVVSNVRLDNEIKISDIIVTTVSKDSDDNSEKSNSEKLTETDEVYTDNSSYKTHSSEKETVDTRLNIEFVIEKKYLGSIILNKKKYYEELKDLNSQNYKFLELNVLKNNYSSIITSLSNGDILYKNDEHYNIIKICSNKNCDGKCEKKYCSKSGLYYSLWNNIRGSKTIYNLLLKLTIIFPQFRDRCKCCENSNIKMYLESLEENFNTNLFSYEESDSNKLELKINYLVNKFMSVIGIMSCQCKFMNKYYEFYQDDYLNFRKIYKIYKRTIPHIVIMLKTYFNIKENHEELALIKEGRCIHEDIRYNNMTYCLKKKYTNLDRRKLIEIINNLELVNNWSMESFKISLLLFNEQSLETFRHILFKYKKEVDIIDLFKRIYSKKNNILDLNYVVNKKNLINSIFNALNTKKTFEIEQGKTLINEIILQLNYRNKKYKDVQNKLNEIMIQYLIECYNYGHIRLGLEFFKNIKKLDDIHFMSRITNSLNYSKYSIINIFPKELNKNSNHTDLLKYIFDTIMNSNSSYHVKVSYLKIINKNKINVINYDFINRLIDIPDGEKIVLDLPKTNKKDEILNYFLSIPDYKNINHINATIKKCVINKTVNILDYFLGEINYKIKITETNPYVIYFMNIEDYRKEGDYIELLKVITKYNYNINNYVSFEEMSNKYNLSLMHFCIKNKLNESAKILIYNSIDTSIITNNKNFLFYCIDNKNHIVFGEILNNNFALINHNFNNIKLHTYLFLNKELEENVLMRFLIKLLSNKEFDANYSDRYNLHIGFQILESKLDKRNKVMLFKIISEQIEPMVLKNNIPLIMYSVVLDEYEISYMLLTKIFKTKGIKKSSNFNPYFDYEFINDKININFIPLIFKYIKENMDENKIIIDKIYLETDMYIENILMMIMEMILCILIYKNYKNTKKIELVNNNRDDINGYLKLVEDIDKGKDKDKEQESHKLNMNGYIEISIETDENEIFNKVNKNIWKNVKYKPENKDERSIKNSNAKFNFKSETDEENMKDTKNFSIDTNSSELSESNICFDNLL